MWCAAPLEEVWRSLRAVALAGLPSEVCHFHSAVCALIHLILNDASDVNEV